MSGDAGREAAFQDRLEALRRRYLERLTVLADQAGSLARELGRGEDPTPHRELRRLLHSLAGTAPTYGFPEVARAAGEAMALVDGAGGAPRFPGPGELDQGLAGLRRAVELARDQG